MEKPKRVETREPEPHDFFSCEACKAAGQNIKQGILRIHRWAIALTEIAPPPEIGDDEDDPEEKVTDGINVFAVTEGLAWAIRYEAQQLESDVSSRAVCAEEWDRLHDVHDGRDQSRARPERS